MPANTFDEVLKFNPYHGKDGRFSNADSYATFTYAPGKSKAHDNAIARERERTATGEYKSDFELDQALYASHSEAYNNLSVDEQKAITKYMSSSGITDSYKNKGLVDKAIQKTELPVDARLTRGVTDLPTTMEEAQKLIGSTIGTRVEGKPISTSVKSTQNWGTATISIRAKKGTKGMYVEVARQSKKAQQNREKAAKTKTVVGEAEFLLPSTTTLKITGVRMGSFNGKDKIIYDAVVDGQLKKSATETSEVQETTMQRDSETVAKTFDEIIKSNTAASVQTDDSITIYKTDDDKRLVFGWASISITIDGEQLVDRQQDMIDPEDLEEAAYEYVLNFRDTGEEHISTMRKKGKLVESCVFTAEKQKAMGIPEGTLPIGWWIGFKIEDDDAWERVKNGTYRMFSIEGRANREPVEKSVETVENSAKTFDEILERSTQNGNQTEKDGADQR